MGFYKDLAAPLAMRGIPTVPLRPKTKQAFIDGWQTLATTDISQIILWDAQYPDANCGSVAKAELGAVWFFEYDSGVVGARVGADTHQKLPDTFRVMSSPGRGHIYFRQSPASLAMGNIAQGFVKGGDWSARVSNEYVVSPGSIHPRTNLPYEVTSEAPIIEAPQWFIDWCISQKVEKTNKNVSADPNGPKIPRGQHDDQLLSISGKLRHIGMEEEGIYEALVEIVEKRCENYGDDYLDMCRKHARNICKHDVGQDTSVRVNGRLAGSAPSTPPVAQSTITDEFEDAVPIPTLPYPVFPYWVMNGTSIYEGLVKPFCDVNSRYPEFMFMPAVALFLNYIGTKVYVEGKNVIPSIFMVSVGRAGQVIKSSCVQDAITYFEHIGMVGHGDATVNNANSRALVFSAGSPEGLGKEMNRLNCKNGVLFYDELTILANKASIDSSTLTANLLLLYESGKFQGLTKSTKDNYSLLPGTYCASLIACCTDKNFALTWSKLAGKSTGLNDRFFFLYQPETLHDMSEYIAVSTVESSAKTRQLVEKAMAQKSFKIVASDKILLNRFRKDNENQNRAAIRAEKFALYFAIDQGKDEIDGDCIEKGLALVEYELAVKKYLQIYEAATKEGALQMEVMYQLRKANGSLSMRDVYRLIHPERYGTSMWAQVYTGLIRHGWCEERGTGKKGDPKRLVVLRLPEEDD